MRRPRQGWMSAAAATAIGLTVSACDIRAAGEEVVDGRLQVTVPEGWQAQDARSGVFSSRYAADSSEGAPTLALAGHFGNFGTARVGLMTLIGDTQTSTPGFRVEDTTDISVPGATSAVRLDFRYGTEETRGVFEGMWIVASDADSRQSIALALSAPEIDEAVAEQVQDSLVMVESSR